MFFTPRVVLSAGFRQCRNDGCGSWCAKCGKSLFRIKECPIPRDPRGRRNTENCIIVCPDCLSKIEAKYSGKEIPYSDIPYFDRTPPNWPDD
jgi:hypothetical protein